ncbi:MAG TPA: phosphotransferase, partial [Ilumatobacteraceae bacterium]|nr:phosphotransferase [Ilumatobacteraceae bacterium]
DGTDAVLKVFASPRARGNDRRLAALAVSSANHLVPRSLGVDHGGHVSLISWSPGTVYDELSDTAFIAAAPAVGAALSRLHRCGVVVDREWTVEKELAQLVRRATTCNRPLIDSMIADTDAIATVRNAPLVTSHRDCHPRQVVFDSGRPSWIDLDDCAMAPAGLDVGNFVAHLRRDAAIERRTADVTDAATEGFCRGYGELPTAAAWWERVSLIRLVGLAESRHHRPDWAAAIEGLLVPQRATL